MLAQVREAKGCFVPTNRGEGVSGEGRQRQSDPLTADIRSALDAGRHRKAMNDNFGEFVTALGHRATSAVLWNRSLASRFSRWASDRKWPPV